MSQAQSAVYWSDAAQRGQAEVLDLYYVITGAKASTSKNANVSLTTYDAFASQAVINTFLGTTDEFLLAAFDATAMGADAFGGVVNMAGQAKELLAMKASCYSGTDGGTSVVQSVASVSTLTASSLTTQCALGSSGNLAFRVNFGNTPDFDALTSGIIHIQLVYRIK